MKTYIQPKLKIQQQMADIYNKAAQGTLKREGSQTKPASTGAVCRLEFMAAARMDTLDSMLDILDSKLDRILFLQGRLKEGLDSLQEKIIKSDGKVWEKRMSEITAPHQFWQCSTRRASFSF